MPLGVLTDEETQAFIDGYPAELPAFGTIGEDDASHGQALAFLMRVGRQAALAREDHVEQATLNAKVFQWGKEHKATGDDLVANDIQTAILSITDLQTREPFSIFIRPVQTRDKAQVFWVGPPVDERLAMLVPGLPLGLGMEPVIDPMTGQPVMQPQLDPMTGAMIGATPMMQPATSFTPLDDVTAWMVKRLAATGAFPAEWFVSVDDRLVADVYQTVFDVFWKENRIDDFIRENLLKTNIYGYQGSYYSWDADLKKHVVRDVSIKQLLLDAKAEGTNFDLQNCPGFEIVMDLDQAKAEWPQLGPLLDEYARQGTPARVDSTSEFGIASDRNFEQRTVTFRIHWFRNQLVPMLPQEAEKSGKVVRTSNPVTGEQEWADAATQQQQPAPITGGMGNDVGAGTSGMGNELPTVDGGDTAQAGAEEAGELQPVPADAAPVDAPPAPAWPLTRAIRQIATLAQTGRIIQDIRNEHWDIPMLLNVCIPLPSQPFGQGLPEKLAGMQAADIRLLNAVVRYAETFSNPGCMIPQSVADALKKELKRTHIDPKETMIAPDHLFERFGEKTVLWFQPPQMPPAVPLAMDMIDKRKKESSGHPEVMSGTAPSPTSSGRMVEALQAGAAGQFGFQAQWTAKMVERLSNLMHYTHLWRLTIDDIHDIYPRLPIQLLQMVIDIAQRRRWDNQVDANSGTSGQTAKKLQRALALFSAVSKTGEPAMPLKMVREEANIDNEEASLAWREELLSSMPAAPAPMGQPQPEQQPGEQMQPASDGQGTANNGM